ncbi:MAG: NAAT family transporter [Bacteroidetes bacterium]|jgi:multiple antibiotic resistance protein|nr:NAAT family transporter [Bacteroidota bacterium]
MLEFLNLFLILFAVIDPLGSIPVFMEATKSMDKFHKRKVAINASITAFLVLLFFIGVGQIVLDSMEISLEAFQISGGVILFLFALTMIFGQSKPESEKELIDNYKHVTVFPVAMPSIASPGAIMAVVLLTDNQTYDFTHQLLISLIALIIIGITCLLLLLSGLIQKRFGESGIIVISKVMGLILASYAAQSILSGIKVFFLT